MLFFSRGGIHVKIWEAKQAPGWRPGCDQGCGRQKRWVELRSWCEACLQEEAQTCRGGNSPGTRREWIFWESARCHHTEDKPVEMKAPMVKIAALT